VQNVSYDCTCTIISTLSKFFLTRNGKLGVQVILARTAKLYVRREQPHDTITYRPNIEFNNRVITIV
jgi:hypothetical protein